MKFSHPKLIIHSDMNGLSSAAVDIATTIAKKSIAKRGQFNLVLAGGGTPLSLYRLLSNDEVFPNTLWEHTHLFWGDERNVPPDHDDSNYNAAYSVLIELVRVLGEYRDNLVLIGGWVPQILFQNKSELHIGSIDIDLALNHKLINDEGYKGIHDLLVNSGYQQGKQPFIFKRKVSIEGIEVSVQVDLLSGEYEGTGKSHRHQRIQKIHARKVRGCDLAFNDPVRLKTSAVPQDIMSFAKH